MGYLHVRLRFVWSFYDAIFIIEESLRRSSICTAHSGWPIQPSVFQVFEKFTGFCIQLFVCVSVSLIFNKSLFCNFTTSSTVLHHSPFPFYLIFDIILSFEMHFLPSIPIPFHDRCFLRNVLIYSVPSVRARGFTIQVGTRDAVWILGLYCYWSSTLTVLRLKSAQWASSLAVDEPECGLWAKMLNKSYTCLPWGPLSCLH